MRSLARAALEFAASKSLLAGHPGILSRRVVGLRLDESEKSSAGLNMPNLTIEQRRGHHSHRELRYRG